MAEQYLFQSVNAERSAAGLPRLVWNQSLSAAALRHAEQMQRRRTISHQFENEPDLPGRAASAGARFSRVTENVATSDSMLTMHEALMQSPHHRENILDPRVTSMGVAVVAGRGEFWGVEDFSREVARLSLSDQESEVAKRLAATGLPQISITQDARTTCQMTTGYAGTRPWFVMRYTTGDLNQLPEQLTLRIAEGRLRRATVGACTANANGSFTSFSIAVLLFPK